MAFDIAYHQIAHLSWFTRALLFGLAMAGCVDSTPTRDTANGVMSPSYHPLLLKDRYNVNLLTGDSISMLRAGNGEVIPTGRPLPLTKESWTPLQVAILKARAGKPTTKKWSEPTSKVRPLFREIMVEMRSAEEGDFLIDTFKLNLVKLKVQVPTPVESPPASRKELNPMNIQSVGIEHGLRSLVLWDGIEDAFGNMWMVSEGGGLSKYNGEQMQTYGAKEGLTTDVLLEIFLDSKGKIWLGGWGGNVMVYDGYDFHEVLLTRDGSYPLVNEFMEDSTGAIWISTDRDGVFRIMNGSIQNIKEVAQIGKVEGFCRDASNRVWIGGEKGVIRSSEGKYEVFIFPTSLHQFGITPTMVDKEKSAWFIAWGNSLIRYNGHSFQELTTEGGLINNRVMELTQDHGDNIWIGTQGGLQKYRDGLLENFTVRSGLVVNDVYGLHVDRRNNLWLAFSGGGLGKLIQNGLTNRTTENWMPFDQLSFIVELSSGRKGLGFWGNGLVIENDGFHEIYKEGQGLRSNYILNMYADNDLVYFQDFEGLVSFDGESFSYFQIEDKPYVVYNYCTTKDSELWLGMREYGIVKKDGETFYQLKLPYMDVSGTYPVHTDPQGDVWIGVDKHLARIRDNEVLYLTHAEGFFNTKSIQRITHDTKGNIWIATKQAGLFRFDGLLFVR